MAGTGRFQPQPIQGNKLVDGDGHPTEAYRKWFDKLPGLASPALTGTVPTSAASQGIKGQIATDGNFVYVCIEDNQWKRAALVAF